MPDLFYPSSDSLHSLLSEIDDGKIVLPSFQRHFDWDNPRQDALVRSVLNSYPAGSILFLQQPEGEGKLGKRLITGVSPSRQSVHPTRIILDGQQRLTTLYHVLHGIGQDQERRSLVDLNIVERYFDSQGELPDSSTEKGINLVKESVQFLSAESVRSHYSTLDAQFVSRILPLTCVFGKNVVIDAGSQCQIGIDEWKDKYAEYYEPNDQTRRLALKRKLDEIKKRFIEPIDKYRFPVVVLQEKTEPQAVCQVFVDLNIQQKPLDPFEVVAARVWPYGMNLYDEWEKASSIPSINQFEVDPVIPLKAIALIQTSQLGKTSCRKKALYQIEPQTFTQMWSEAVTTLDKCLLLLQGEGGVLHPKWLPYTSLFACMTSAFMMSSQTGLSQAEVKSRLLRWFWCSVFTESYSSTTDTQNANDFDGLRNWFRGGPPPYSVNSFQSLFNADILKTVTWGGRYRGVFCLLMNRRAREFGTGQGINTTILLSENVDDHHIFPDDYLEHTAGVADWSMRNCVLNRTLIDEHTNRGDIGNKPPSQYLAELRRRLGARKLNEILESHLIPTGNNSPLNTDDYSHFLEERQQLIAQEITRVTS